MGKVRVYDSQKSISVEEIKNLGGEAKVKNSSLRSWWVSSLLWTVSWIPFVSRFLPADELKSLRISTRSVTDAEGSQKETINATLGGVTKPVSPTATFYSRIDVPY